jgi:hypothetical protein
MSLLAEHFIQPLAANRLKAAFQKKVYRGLMMRTLFMIGILLTLSSCSHTYQFTYTKKSGIEQLLVTKAVDEAIQMMTVDLKGSKVFVDVACLMRDEQSYIRKAFTHWFLEAGVFISEYPWDADYIVSVLVKVAGTDGDQLSLGIPSIPVPLAIGITTPALTLLSQINQEGRVDMEAIIYSTNRGIKEKITSLRGNSYYKKYVILFIPFTRKDIALPQE